MEFARKIKDEEKQGRATMVLATPEDERLREKFYDQVLIVVVGVWYRYLERYLL